MALIYSVFLYVKNVFYVVKHKIMSGKLIYLFI